MIIDAQKNDKELHKKLQMVRDGDKTEFFRKRTLIGYWHKLVPSYTRITCVKANDYRCSEK